MGHGDIMTTFTLAQILATVEGMTHNDGAADLTDADKEEAIKAALLTYSRDMENTTTDDISGNDTRYYALTGGSAVLTSFSDDFSVIELVEYPAADISLDETPIYLDPDDYDTDYNYNNVRYLKFNNISPSSTETIRITYTIPYEFDGSDEVDLPAQHYYPFCKLAACVTSRYLANYYSQAEDTQLTLESARHGNKSTMWATRAQEWCAGYREDVGLLPMGSDGTTGISGYAEFTDWDVKPLWPSGARFLFHRNR